MKLSIIAPAYKVDNYIQDFIDSLIYLKHINYEVLIVNDDPQNDIDFLSKQNKNIKIINNKKNIGILLSRYEGIKNLNNDTTHVIFIDPDDKINGPEFLKYIDDKIVNFSYNEWYKNKKIWKKCTGNIGPQKLDNHIWGMLFPIKVIKNNMAVFRNDEFNDDFMIKEILSRKYDISISNEVLVDYRMRKSSASRKGYNKKMAEKEIYSLHFLYKEFNEEHFLKRAVEELYIRKGAFTKSEFKKWKYTLGNKFSLSGTLYRIFKFDNMKFWFSYIFLNNKMF